MSISIFLAYVYSLTTCLMLFHKTVPPSKGRWWYTFFLVLPCLCPFPILYKWVESLECSCTWQPELENDVYVGYIWRIYTMYVLGARYQARTSRVFISRSSPGFTSCYGQMRNSNKLGTQMSVWRILLFHMGLRLSMVKRSIPWTCMERIQLIWNVRSTFNLCPWLWWFEWECPPYRLVCLKTLALLEEVYHWGWALKCQKPTPLPVSSVCPLLYRPWYESSAAAPGPAQASLLPTITMVIKDSNPLELWAPN